MRWRVYFIGIGVPQAPSVHLERRGGHTDVFHSQLSRAYSMKVDKWNAKLLTTSFLYTLAFERVLLACVTTFLARDGSYFNFVICKEKIQLISISTYLSLIKAKQKERHFLMSNKLTSDLKSKTGRWGNHCHPCALLWLPLPFKAALLCGSNR